MLAKLVFAGFFHFSFCLNCAVWKQVTNYNPYGIEGGVIVHLPKIYLNYPGFMEILTPNFLSVWI